MQPVVSDAPQRNERREKKTWSPERTTKEPSATSKETTKTPPTTTKNLYNDDKKIDIVSVGSLAESDLISAQKESFGRHRSVRNFHHFVESDDDERNCSIDLTKKSWVFISEFCRSQKTDRYWVRRLRSLFASPTHLQKKGNRTAGWLCAQKRPAESLYKVLKSYNSRHQLTTTATDTGNTTTSAIVNQVESHVPIPDYLFLLDADTYLNLDKIMGSDKNDGFLPQIHMPDEPSSIAGCLIRERVKELNFTFPWGGFGTIFTKKSIERFVYPIQNCTLHGENNDGSIYALGDTDELLDPETKISLKTMHHRQLTDDEFNRLVCSRLREDRIGEAHLFQKGMSVADLMYRYVTNWKYVGAENSWSTDPNHLRPPRRDVALKPDYKQIPKFVPGGFCLHADWVMGYFVNHYYLSTHSGQEFFRNNPEDRMYGYRGSEHYAGKQTQKNKNQRKECDHDYDKNCDTTTSHICHHISASKMRELSSLR